MTPENVMDLAHSTLTVTTMIAAPLLLTALVTGLVIGMLQAATQINEATLSFIPKLLVLVIDLVVASVLMSMGMMMLSPTLVSLPFKIMLFVVVDGWTLLIGTLAGSFHR